jgi:hypothetical protein
MRPLLDWYQRIAESLTDRMCCSSYSSQVYDEEERIDYDELRAKMVVPDWIQEHDEQNSMPRKEHKGHITLQGDLKDQKGSIYVTPYKSDRSVATATTVSTSTARTLGSIATATTLNTSNQKLRSSDQSISSEIVDDNVYVRSHSCEERKSKAPREIDVTRYRRHHSETETSPRLRTVPSDALPSLPYLTLTEGYEC